MNNEYKMLISNDFGDEYALMGYLNDVVVRTSPTKVRSTNLVSKRVKTRYIQPILLQKAFNGLVADWKKSGPSLTVFFQRYPDLKARMTYGKTVLYVALDGSAQITWTPTTAPIPADGEAAQPISAADEALDLFMRFITSPLQNRLGGPCASTKCGRLFFKTSNRVRKYCSKRCGLVASAVSATAKQRQELRRRKLDLAQAAIERWLATSRRPSDWKRWVERHTSTQKRAELRLTMKWLTRAVGKGELTDPTREGHA